MVTEITETMKEWVRKRGQKIYNINNESKYTKLATYHQYLCKLKVCPLLTMALETHKESVVNFGARILGAIVNEGTRIKWGETIMWISRQLN